MFEKDTVFVDIETTGGNALRDRITEIAILTMQNGVLISEWSTLVNPYVLIPETIQSLTGITNEMVMDESPFEDLYKDIYQRLEGHVFVAHNARFDYGFLKNAFSRCGITFRAPVLCTVKLSRNLFPEFKRHNLDNIMQRHGLQCSARHRASGDARVLFDFMQVLYNTQEHDRVNEVISQLLKRPSLPRGIDEDDIDKLPDAPGVYVFNDEKGAPLYIGKSKRIRDRVLSHFNSDYRSGKEMNIAQNVASISHIQTAGELGALLQEARMIKKFLPIYNRRLRRYDSLYTIQWDPLDELSIPMVVNESELDVEDIQHHFGLFKSKKAAKDTLRSLAKEHQLCEKKLGLEAGKGSCFAYQLKRCRGACIEKESVMQHNVRVLQALQPLKNKVWPFDGCIGIRERSYHAKWTDIHLFDNWCYLGTVNDESNLHQMSLFERENKMFDLDTYKILLRFMKDNQRLDIISIA